LKASGIPQRGTLVQKRLDGLRRVGIQALVTGESGEEAFV
jgi:hypothetical protein